ncbi:hypothetical protein HAX54_013122 [Datura stramonium]|uniref:Uncharacterized protein n=1 Tax=Datura stramonium TaxID=4076 RepID=A0ABS8TMR5_DATST|nr:hypothetical protein [Datura stramonium]
MDQETGPSPARYVRVMQPTTQRSDGASRPLMQRDGACRRGKTPDGASHGKSFGTGILARISITSADGHDGAVVVSHGVLEEVAWAKLEEISPTCS